jgi:hypothetical protein
MKLLQTLLVDLVVATAAPPPRAPGRDHHVAAQVWLGLVLAQPIFLALRALLHLITLAHPVARQPDVDFALVALCGGIIVATELVRSWRAPIEARRARLERLPPQARRQWRVRVLAGGVAASLVVLALFGALLQR